MIEGACGNLLYFSERTVTFEGGIIEGHTPIYLFFRGPKSLAP